MATNPNLKRESTLYKRVGQKRKTEGIQEKSPSKRENSAIESPKTRVRKMEILRRGGGEAEKTYLIQCVLKTSRI